MPFLKDKSALIQTVRKRMSECALFLALLLGALILCIPACSTVSTVASGDSYLYSGTRANITHIGPRDEGPFKGILRCVAIFDFPCSLALDTALIPFTLPMQLIVGDDPQSPLGLRPPLEKSPKDEK